MKKFFIGMTALLMCVTLVGCGDNAGEASLNNLGSQLDETSNIISSVQMVNPADITMTKDMLQKIATSENSAAIYDNVIGTQQTLLNEEYFKTNIISQTAKLKNNLSKDLKLSKAQATAIKELTNNLEKYSNSVAYTQNDLSSTLRQISSLKKNVEKNSDKINAKLNRLACNSNARTSYYENILFTLRQIEAYLNVPQEENQENSQDGTYQNTPETNSLTSETKICPNCNTTTQSETCENCGYEFNQGREDEPTATNASESSENNEAKANSASKEASTNNPYTKFNSNNINRANLVYPFGYGYAYPYGMGMNGYGMYGAYGMNGLGGAPYGQFGAYPYGYGGGYGNGMYGGFGMNGFGTPYSNGGMNGNNINFARFNPNRNTDTYAPLVRNIDTYRAGTQLNVTSKLPQNSTNQEKVETENNKKIETDDNEKIEERKEVFKPLKKDPPVYAH